VRSEDVDTRLGDRELLRARAGVTARAAGVVEESPIRPDPGEVAVRRRRSRPSDHARACVCGEQLVLRVGSTLTREHARAGGSTHE